MTSHITAGFCKHYDRLPESARRRARTAYERFRRDPTQHGLYFKLVKPRHNVWSARVSDDYRVLGKRKGDTIWWFWIGTHADYDALLDQL